VGLTLRGAVSDRTWQLSSCFVGGPAGHDSGQRNW